MEAHSKILDLNNLEIRGHAVVVRLNKRFKKETTGQLDEINYPLWYVTQANVNVK